MIKYKVNLNQNIKHDKLSKEVIKAKLLASEPAKFSKVKINISLRSNNQADGVVPLVEVGGAGQVATGQLAHFLFGSVVEGAALKVMESPADQEKATIEKELWG